MIEHILKLVDFLASYPNWVKYAVASLLVAILVLLIAFRPALGSGLKLRVYHFENWSERAADQHLGERFSGMILDDLLRRNVHAQEATGTPPTTDIFQFRSGPPQDLITEFNAMAPFISVNGFVEDRRVSGAIAHIRITRVDAGPRIKTLLIEEIKFEDDPEAMRQAARAVSEKIDSVIQAEASSREASTDDT
jgi:hypothetical protein